MLDSTERRNAPTGERDYRRVIGGLLAQDRDADVEDREGMIVVCGEPSEADWGDLLFAWRVCKHVTSNAIVIAKDLRTIGIGAGQMSRVDAVRIAVEKAREHGHDLEGAALASDAFFPFPDGPRLALEAGVARDHPAGRLEARLGRGRRGQRRRRDDGLHRPAPLPPLTTGAAAPTLRARTRPRKRPVRPETAPVIAISVQARWKCEMSTPAAGPSTAISVEIPSAAPICRNVLLIAPPVAKRSRGSSATAALPNAAKLRPTPIPVRIVAGRNAVA